MCSLRTAAGRYCGQYTHACSFYGIACHRFSPSSLQATTTSNVLQDTCIPSCATKWHACVRDGRNNAQAEPARLSLRKEFLALQGWPTNMGREPLYAHRASASTARQKTTQPIPMGHQGTPGACRGPAPKRAFRAPGLGCRPDTVPAGWQPCPPQPPLPPCWPGKHTALTPLSVHLKHCWGAQLKLRLLADSGAKYHSQNCLLKWTQCLSRNYG